MFHYEQRQTYCKLTKPRNKSGSHEAKDASEKKKRKDAEQDRKPVYCKQEAAVTRDTCSPLSKSGNKDFVLDNNEQPVFRNILTLSATKKAPDSLGQTSHSCIRRRYLKRYMHHWIVEGAIRSLNGMRRGR